MDFGVICEVTGNFCPLLSKLGYLHGKLECNWLSNIDLFFCTEFEAVGTELQEEVFFFFFLSIHIIHSQTRFYRGWDTWLPPPLVLLCCKHLKTSLLPKWGFTAKCPEIHLRIHWGIIKGPEGPKYASAQNVGTSVVISTDTVHQVHLEILKELGFSTFQHC